MTTEPRAGIVMTEDEWEQGLADLQSAMGVLFSHEGTFPEYMVKNATAAEKRSREALCQDRAALVRRAEAAERLLAIVQRMVRYEDQCLSRSRIGPHENWSEIMSDARVVLSALTARGGEGVT